MKAWLSNNWDKVLFPILGIIISGITGFYAGLYSIEQKVFGLTERTAKLETELTSLVKPKLDTVDANNNTIIKVSYELEQIQKQTDISIQTNKLLDLRLESQKKETLEELRKLIELIKNEQ